MTMISLNCFVCLKRYDFALKFYNLRKKRSPNSNNYCSHTCHNKSRIKNNQVACDECGKLFLKNLFQIIKTKHNFCTKSCSATYQNKHKIIGIRRSKLEKFIEQQISQYFPQTKCLFNDHTAIGSELDIYLSDLKLAIQINGITHYQPIYGQKKFDKIKNGDFCKRIQCDLHHIKLFEIDVSRDTNFDKTKNSRWNEIKSIIDLNLMQIKGSSL